MSLTLVLREPEKNDSLWVSVLDVGICWVLPLWVKISTHLELSQFSKLNFHYSSIFHQIIFLIEFLLLIKYCFISIYSEIWLSLIRVRMYFQITWQYLVDMEKAQGSFEVPKVKCVYLGQTGVCSTSCRWCTLVAAAPLMHTGTLLNLAHFLG